MKKPFNLTELSDALKNPLLDKPTACRHTDYLEALKDWQPLTLEMVRERLAKEREARDAILAAYIDRTGQEVVLCDECSMGVGEEEHEEGWQTVVVETKCEACDGLGVKTI